MFELRRDIEVSIPKFKVRNAVVKIWHFGIFDDLTILRWKNENTRKKTKNKARILEKEGIVWMLLAGERSGEIGEQICIGIDLQGVH